MSFLSGSSRVLKLNRLWPVLFCALTVWIGCSPDGDRDGAPESLVLETGWQEHVFLEEHGDGPPSGDSPDWRATPDGNGQRPTPSNGLIWLRGPELPEWSAGRRVLHLPYVEQTLIVYVNGTEIYRFGDPGAGPAGYAGWPPHIIPLPDDWNQGGDRRPYFLVHAGAGSIGSIGVINPARFGTEATVLKHILSEDLHRLVLAMIFLLMGVFALALFVYNRERELVGSFGFFAFMSGLYLLSNRTVQLQYVLWYRPDVWIYVEFFSLFLMPVGLGFYFARVARSRIALGAAVVLLVYATGAAMLHGLGVPIYRFLFPFFNTSLVCASVLLFVLFRESLRDNVEARIAALASLIFISVAIYDMLGALRLIYWPRQLLVWGQAGFMLALGGIILRRYNLTYRQLAEYSRDLETARDRLSEHAELLERRVAERTEHLNRSLQEVRALSERQDGDYYLISLLMQPLLPRPAALKTVAVEMALEQKKQFEFKGKRVELGGDLCLAQEVELQKRKYIAFVNADAMGKSMQGAGGAIVLGTVFGSLIQRTALSVSTGNRKPETFLRECYRELNRVFLSFEGRMLTTMLLGLVDEKGKVFSINCEHPGLVLLRDGQAEFVPDEKMTGKLGIPTGEPTARSAPGSWSDLWSNLTAGETAKGPGINQLQLQVGDVLLMGSDGKDDILKDPTADPGDAREYNDDERLFLNWVERTDGRPDQILDLLRERGGITDDVSILSVRYTG